MTQLPTIILDALQNPMVASLHQTIESQTNLVYAPSTRDCWESSTVSGMTTITYLKCAHPAEAFAHELLHAKLKLSGFRQHLVGLTKRPCSNQCQQEIMRLLHILDTELQHHRMEHDFRALGLNSDFFYNDGDVHTFKKVRRELEGMTPKNAVSDFFRVLVSIIAPGGAQSATERKQIRTFLDIRAQGKIANIMKRVEDLFSAWSASPSLDHAPFLKSILELICTRCTYWVGTTDGVTIDFPKGGFFVGEPFTMEERQPLG